MHYSRCYSSIQYLFQCYYGFKVSSLVDCLREIFEYNAMTDFSLSSLHLPVQGLSEEATREILYSYQLVDIYNISLPKNL